jgi:hypothetical protein
MVHIGSAGEVAENTGRAQLVDATLACSLLAGVSSNVGYAVASV